MPVQSLPRHRQRRRQRRALESSARTTAFSARATKQAPQQRATSAQRKVNLHPWASKGISRLQYHRSKSIVSTTR